MGVYKWQIFCNTVCRNDIVKFECNTPKIKVFPFCSLYGLGPFTCLNSELTSETINPCPTFSRTPYMGDPVSQGHYPHRTKHKSWRNSNQQSLLNRSKFWTVQPLWQAAMAINTLTLNIMTMVMGIISLYNIIQWTQTSWLEMSSFNVSWWALCTEAVRMISPRYFPSHSGFFTHPFIPELKCSHLDQSIPKYALQSLRVPQKM